MRAKLSGYRSAWRKTAELALAIHALGEVAIGGSVIRRELARAAGEALKTADGVERTIYEAEFVERMKFHEVCERLNASQSYYYRARGGLLDKVAAKLKA